MNVELEKALLHCVQGEMAVDLLEANGLKESWVVTKVLDGIVGYWEDIGNETSSREQETLVNGALNAVRSGALFLHDEKELV